MAPATRARTASTTPKKRKNSDENGDNSDDHTVTAAVTPKKKRVAATPKKQRAIAIPATPDPAPTLNAAAHLVESDTDNTSHIIVRPQLSFDYEAAKRHLIAADARFGPMMDALKCKPFQDQADLNPFRALCSSILGQQISWLAARSITHKFIRLVAFPDLPEKPDPNSMTTSFPTPLQVSNTSIEVLRSAGLSQRKAEYIKDLSARFVDGRLSSEKLIEMTDEQVMDALIQVRGIGRWTVEMFMIFTLRRQDVLPCGDLGIQKGLVRWWTQVNPSIHSKKLPASSSAATTAPVDLPISSSASSQPSNGHRALTPPPASSSSSSVDKEDYFKTPSTPMFSEIDASPSHTPKNSTRPPPMYTTPGRDPDADTGDVIDVPLMTPRTERSAELPPFPESKTLTRESCKARLNKKIK
jgi:DNA-3-methyladenine glycosylase II